MTKIVRMERSETKNSKSPMWYCVTASGERVNVFQHEDSRRDNFHLFEGAGYAPEMLKMQFGDVLHWTGYPVAVELTQNGKWHEVVSVAPRLASASPDVMLVPDKALWAEVAVLWAACATDLDLPVVVLDTETTGLTAQDEVIEIAVVNVYGEWLFNQLVQPSSVAKVTQEIQDLTGITQAMVSDAPTFPEIYEALATLLNGKIWLIYNAKFDMAMLDAMCMRHGLAPIRPLAYSCVMERFAEWYGEWKQDRFIPKPLEFACTCFEIFPPGHRALEDAQATVKLIQAMAGE